MLQILLIALGCAIGGVLRFLVANATHLFLSRDFPYGTLIVNVSGSIIMGILFVLVIERMGAWSVNLRALLMIGFLGGYTTFSTFSLETVILIEDGQVISALLNMFLSCILCVAGTWAGILIARFL